MDGAGEGGAGSHRVFGDGEGVSDSAEERLEVKREPSLTLASGRLTSDGLHFCVDPVC